MIPPDNNAAMAAAVVEGTFPPSTVDGVLRIAAALNLLNAVVKQPEGRRLTSYHYIKGMAACLFVWLLYHPQEGVELYWDEQQDITYICLHGQQYSFHYVPLVRHYVRLRQHEGLTPQVWDGVERQHVAEELFRKAVGEPLPVVDEEKEKQLVSRMRHFNKQKLIGRVNALEGVEPIVPKAPDPPVVKQRAVPRIVKSPARRFKHLAQLRTFVQRHLPSPDAPVTTYGGWKREAEEWKNAEGYRPMYNLALALKFNGWWEEGFELSRKGDFYCYRIVKYNGRNYNHVVTMLADGSRQAHCRPQQCLHRRWHYFVRRATRRWKHMTYSRYIYLLAHCNYLTVDGTCYNLCITYGLARYLAKAYPQLRFINVLNFTRFKVRRRVYTYKDLLRVPLHSPSRQLKVWLVIDPRLLLADLDIEQLPQPLLKEYRSTEDFYQFFVIEHHNGKVGLKAYSRFHLLPTVFNRIYLRGHFADVENDKGKWAVYNLIEEGFESDFIYEPKKHKKHAQKHLF